MADPSPRQRMIESAVLLMGEHGVDGTSFSEVLERSGAPRGSIYHHFPGGKSQLIQEATRHGGDLITAGLRAALEREDPLAAIEGVVNFWRAALRQTNFAVGCPVVAATVEGDRTPDARAAAAETFGRWEGLHSQILERAGVPRERARSVATLLVAAVEGAIILSRAEGSSQPLEHVADELHTLLHAALEHAQSS